MSAVLDPTAENRDPVEVLADEFLAARRRGEAVTVGEFAERHPQHAASVRRLFPVMLRLEDDATDAPAVPDRVGRFPVRRLVGEGGFGVVLEAEDPKLGRRLALKVPRPGALATPDARDRFRREAECVARLDHPNIVPVYEADTAGEPWYIASAFVAGQTLDDVLDGCDGTLEPPEAAAAVRTLAAAVQHAHGRGVLHRDIKPANVLVEHSDGPLYERLRLTDFGLARLATAEAWRTQDRAVVGTPAYMSPEQAAGEPDAAAAAADVYALGAVLFRLLTGRPPFECDDTLAMLQAVRFEEPPRPSSLRPGVPKDLEAVCLKCLEKDPARRYETAAALADDLGRYLDGTGVAARRASLPERSVRWAKRRPAAAALVAVVLLAAVGAAAGGLHYSARLRDQRDELRVMLTRAERAEADSRELAATLARRLNDLTQERTVEELTRAIEADPRPVALAQRGDAYLLLGDYDRALADFEHGLRLEPQHPECMTYLAWIRLLGPERYRDRAAGLTLAEKAWTMRPAAWWLRDAYAYGLYYAGDYGSALTQLEETVRLRAGDTPHVLLQAFLAMTLHRLGRTEEAMRHYRIAAAVLPDQWYVPRDMAERVMAEAAETLGIAGQ